MYFQRDLLSNVLKYFNYPEAIVITGMRRVGKTTVLKHLYETTKTSNKAFFDFENPLHRKKFEKLDYDGILKDLSENGISPKEKAYLFIDEIQNLPAISSVSKYLIDHYQTKFIVTGSSSYYLKNLFPESLSGRKFIFELFPLNFREFLRFKKKKTVKQEKNEVVYYQYQDFYQEYLQWGGFPQIVLEANPQVKKIRLENIFQSYFENDVKKLADFKDLSILRDLIILLANQVGSKTDIIKLASTLSVTRTTIYSYLNFLEATYVIKLLPQYSKNFFRQAAGRKKVYFCDSGLANFLGKLSEGQLFEQSLFQNLRTNHNLAYFDKGRGSEIDFIIDEKTAIEAKISPTRKDLLNLKLRAKSINLSDYKIATLNYSELDSTIPAMNLR